MMLEALIHLIQLLKRFTALKAKTDKIDNNKIVDSPTSLNNLKTKVDDLDVDKLKTVPVDLKKLGKIVDNEVVKNTEFHTLKTKGNNFFFKKKKENS